MKKINYIFFVLPLLLVACVDLDRELNLELTEKQVIESYDRTLNRLSAVYTGVPAGYFQVSGAILAATTDEAEFTQETNAVQRFNNGSWNAIDMPENLWPTLYTGIRRANQLLVGTDSIDLDPIRLDPAQATLYKSRLADIKRVKYEARFLRAYFYFELIKRYGGVPIFTEEVSIDAKFKDVKRNTLQECVSFILSECDSAAKVLPVTYAAGDLGRVTKGTAIALKSRVWLYAASDLFNTPSWAEGQSGYADDVKALISLSNDVSRKVRWDSAARAAKRLIDLPGTGYALSNNYVNMFVGNSFNEKEIIFSRRAGPSADFERTNYPIGYDQGSSGTTPSQDLVDAYEMKDGTPFDWSNPVHAAAPYANRDPRLNFSVLLNNTTYKGRPVEAWTGGRDGQGIPNATKTGYYLKKYVNENVNLLTNGTAAKSWNVIRLAEIYLNYAEALNESDPGNADIALYLNKVRQRSGVAMPAVSPGLSQDEMREKIRNERRVELAFEDHRSWDLRRWLQGEQYLGAPLRGVSITRNADLTFSYSPVVVENRVFSARMYLYPIPQNEVLISPQIKQNPGW